MKPVHIFYISYDGLCEPLGQSQVLRYVLQLAKSNRLRFSILSFEKPQDLKNGTAVAAIRRQLDEVGIKWHPLRYHKSPSLLATFYDIINGIRLLRSVHRQNPIHIIHARSYVSAFIAFLVAPRLSIKWIFDMRGFWPDEKVDAGTWKRGPLYRLVKHLEKSFLKQSDHVISLTQAAVDEILSWPAMQKLKSQKFSVVPTCADLALFLPKARKQKPIINVGYVGGVALWYDFEKALSVFETISAQRPARLVILNKSEHELIRRSLKNRNIDYELHSVSHEEVAKKLADFDLGIFFIRPLPSKKASAPTKLAEFLAAGVPVITSDIGDVGVILRDTGAGVLLDETEPIANAVTKAIRLLEDPATASRCRILAEQKFSLEVGTEEIKEIYFRLSSQD